MQLDVFTPLKDGAMPAKDLADALGVQKDKLQPLLYSLVVAGVLQVDGDHFSNSQKADQFLVCGCPGYIGDLGKFYSYLLDLSLKTAESIRTGQPQAKLDFHALPDEELGAYFQKQVHSSLSGGQEIAKKTNLSNFQRLLDAGGGTGGVSIAVCTKYPHLNATVADLPKVVKFAERFIAEAGLSGRIGVLPIDLCADSPKEKYDAAIVRALIQTLSKEDAQACLKHIGQSIQPGGSIFIFGNILRNSRLKPSAAMAFDVVFLNTYDHGKAYTETEYHEMLTKAGFKDVDITHDALVDGQSLVCAEK